MWIFQMSVIKDMYLNVISTLTPKFSTICIQYDQHGVLE